MGGTSPKKLIDWEVGSRSKSLERLGAGHVQGFLGFCFCFALVAQLPAASLKCSLVG